MSSKFNTLLEELMAKTDVIISENNQITAAHDKVIIDPQQLAKNMAEIVSRKGQPFYNQLRVLANEKRLLTVSAIKRVNRNSGSFTDGDSGTYQEEVDVVSQFNPGNYHSPMSLPITILTKVSDYNGSFNIPLDDNTNFKYKTEKEQRDEYDAGKQPRGTRWNNDNQ